MSKKPKRFLLLLIVFCVPLLGGFGFWWLTTPSQTLTLFIEALEKGETKTINDFLESPYQFESSGDKIGFIGFKEKSPKRRLKIWQDALKKDLKIKERSFTDLLTGQSQATLRVHSTVMVNMGRPFRGQNQAQKSKKGLEPKTLNLTISVNRNKIRLKQTLEEPAEMGIFTYYRTPSGRPPTHW